MTVPLSAVAPDRDAASWSGGNSTLWTSRWAGVDVVCKLFEVEYRRTVDTAALRRLVLFPGDRDDRSVLRRVAMWPSHVLVEDDEPCGVLMDPLDGRFRFDFWGEERVRDLTFLGLTRADALDLKVSYYEPPERLAVLGGVLEGLLDLHALGVVVNDLQSTNIAFSDDLLEVRFLDCDSMHGPWGRPVPGLHPQDVQMRHQVDGAPGDLQLFSLMAVNALQSEQGPVPVRSRLLEHVMRPAQVELLEAALDGRPASESALRELAAQWRESASPDGSFVITGAGRLSAWTEQHAADYEAEVEDVRSTLAPRASPRPDPASTSGPEGRGRQSVLLLVVILALLLVGAAALLISDWR